MLRQPNKRPDSENECENTLIDGLDNQIDFLHL